MANGDLAALKGWTSFPASQAHSLGYDDINYALDRTAQEVDDRAAAVALKFDAAKVIISTSTPTVVNGALWLKPL